MIRVILAVIAGYATWTVLWLGGNAVLFAEAGGVIARGERYDQTGPLLGVVLLSVVCSITSGAVCAAVSRGRYVASIVAAALLLLTGIAVQASAWSLMPVWYHAAFLALVAPGVLLGSRLASGRSPRAA
ncbi:MAG: hypothetical protein AAF937_02530 [Planctomycetota bacterium]